MSNQKEPLTLIRIDANWWRCAICGIAFLKENIDLYPKYVFEVHEKLHDKLVHGKETK